MTPKDPLFPNMLLIIPGSIFLGMAIGVLVALLTELFGRRVRSAEDLQSAFDVPVLAVIGSPVRRRGNARRDNRRERRERTPAKKTARA